VTSPFSLADAVAVIRAAQPTSANVILTKALEEVRDHLACADRQILPSDDQIIADHIRKALALARMALGQARALMQEARQ
jgi:exonuclease VII large subunit